MSRTKSNSFKQANSNYQSLYLWTSFLLGMISLGIVIWNRRSVIPNNAKSLLSNYLIEIPLCTQGDNFALTSQINLPSFTSTLALSALAYQQSGSAMSGLLVGMSSYIHAANAQDIAPALTIDLSNLNQQQGAVFTGGDAAGNSVYIADINKDGNMDLLIGAYRASKVYLVYGPNFNVTNLDGLSGKQGVVFTGQARAGISVYAADVNKDGYMDILIGTVISNKAYLVYGPTFNQTNLDALSGEQGIVFTANRLGTALYVADINQDGYMDIFNGGDITNRLYVIYGPTFNITNLDSLNSMQGIIFTVSGGPSSINVADMNKDGNIDIVVGAFGASKVCIVYGPTFNITNLDALTAQQGVVFSGASGTGLSVNIADVNKDGYMDIITGAYSANKAYLAYGPNFTMMNLDNLSGQEGLVFAGGGLDTGHSVYAADINNDGNIDVIFGAYLLYGPNFFNSTNLKALTFKKGVFFTGIIGVASGNAADLDKDGNLDIIIGTGDAGGKVYIIYNAVFNVFPSVFTTTSLLTTALTSTNPSQTSSNLGTQTMLSQTATQLTSTEPTTVTKLSKIVSATNLQETTLSAENSNSINYIIGAAAGACVVGTLIGAAGFFAVSRCRKNKPENNQGHAMQEVINNNSNVGNLTQGYANPYQAAVVSDNRYSATGLQPGNPEPKSMGSYARRDEVKEVERQYDTPMKLEI